MRNATPSSPHFDRFHDIGASRRWRTSRCASSTSFGCPSVTCVVVNFYVRCGRVRKSRWNHLSNLNVCWSYMHLLYKIPIKHVVCWACMSTKNIVRRMYGEWGGGNQKFASHYHLTIVMTKSIRNAQRGLVQVQRALSLAKRQELPIGESL